jgi:hypothetical protein
LRDRRLAEGHVGDGLAGDGEEDLQALLGERAALAGLRAGGELDLHRRRERHRGQPVEQRLHLAGRQLVERRGQG